MSDLLMFSLTTKLLCGVSFCAVEERECGTSWVHVCPRAGQGEPTRKNPQIHFFHESGNHFTFHERRIRRVGEYLHCRAQKPLCCEVTQACWLAWHPQKGMVEHLSPFRFLVHLPKNSSLTWLPRDSTHVEETFCGPRTAIPFGFVL